MGSIVDLSRPDARLPDRLIVDSSLVIPRFLTQYHSPHPSTAARAASFFTLLGAGPAVGVLTPTSFAEVVHFAIVAHYRLELPGHRSLLAASFPDKKGFDWKDLYKIDHSILRRFGLELRQLRRVLLATGLAFLQPEDFVAAADGRPFDEEMLDTIERFGLDSSDAAILCEAARAGIFAIATLDRDLRRAAADFDVYTWL